MASPCRRVTLSCVPSRRTRVERRATSGCHEVRTTLTSGKPRRSIRSTSRLGFEAALARGVERGAVTGAEEEGEGGEEDHRDEGASEFAATRGDPYFVEFETAEESEAAETLAGARFSAGVGEGRAWEGFT